MSRCVDKIPPFRLNADSSRDYSRAADEHEPRRARARSTRQGRDPSTPGSALVIVAPTSISAFATCWQRHPDKGRSSRRSRRSGSPARPASWRTTCSADPRTFPATFAAHVDLLAGRAMLVRKTTPFPIECVARGYLSGSAGRTSADGGLCGRQAPKGLRESDRLPIPFSRQATKASLGHDVNITAAERPGSGAPHADELHRLTSPLRAGAAPYAGVAGDPAGRHEIRVGTAKTGPPAHRRSHDTGFLALLAGRQYVPAGRRPASTSSSCGDTWRRFAGTSSRRCPRSRTTSWPGHGTSIWRRINA